MRRRDTKKEEPEGSIAFFFHYWPKSIWLKLKPAGLRSDRVAFTYDRTGQVSHQIHYPTCVYLCGNGAAVCQTVSLFFTLFRHFQTQKPKQDYTCRLMDQITSQMAQTLTNKRLRNV